MSVQLVDLDVLDKRLESFVKKIERGNKDNLNGMPFVVTFSTLKYYANVTDQRTLRNRAVKRNIEIHCDPTGREGVLLSDVEKMGLIFD